MEEKYLIKDDPVKGDLIYEHSRLIEGTAPLPEHHFVPIQTIHQPAVSLSVEEILKYQRDPYYVRLRWLLMILIILILIGLLSFVIISVMIIPKCPHRPELKFNQKEILYEIEVATFKDSNGDGIGDLNGISDKLNYLNNDLGVRALSLNRFLSKQTPIQIDTEYGVEADLVNLKKEMNKRDMYLVIEIPASYLETNAEKTINHWLDRGVDGFRVVQGSNSVEELDINHWKELVKQASSKNFAYKYFDVVEKNEGLGLTVERLTTPNSFISELERLYKTSEWPDLIPGNSELERFSTKFERALYDIANALLLLLKGTPIIVAGDEIMLKGTSEVENYMQWDNTNGCGFTENVEIGNYLKNQTGCQNAVLNSISHTSGAKSLVKIYKELSKLRREPSFAWGDVYTASTNKVISFVREAKGFDGFVVAANTGMNKETIDLARKHDIVSKGSLVYFYTPDDVTVASDFEMNKEVRLDSLSLKQGQFLIARFSRE